MDSDFRETGEWTSSMNEVTCLIFLEDGLPVL